MRQQCVPVDSLRSAGRRTAGRFEAKTTSHAQALAEMAQTLLRVEGVDPLAMLRAWSDRASAAFPDRPATQAAVFGQLGGGGPMPA